jgi:hypothetical protein
MKVLLDTSALNWLADHTESATAFFEARHLGVIEVLVPPEAATEVRNTRHSERRALLESLLSSFYPLTPTLVPRLGAFRLGMARLATERDVARLNALRFLRHGQDRNIAANAAGYRCDVFLTCDQEMSVRKRSKVEATLGGTHVLEPEAFVAELRR